MFRRYFSVTKPGIIIGNLISVAGGFLLAARGEIDWPLMLATLMGLSLVVASGCVVNNVIDRDIDAKMARTQGRVTVTGEISASAALLHALVLAVCGFGALIYYTNTLAVGFAAFGYIIYVGIYSLYMKRHSVYGTLVGSLSGAVPPVVGYGAVTGQFDAGAAILLLMFCLWQMPHSYAIAIFRYQDYRDANIPVLPVAKGLARAQRHIVFYIALYALVVMLLPLGGYTGLAFMAVACTTSFWWLLMALRGYRRDIDMHGWARQVFAFSIVNVTVLSITMAVDYHAANPQLLVLN
ncbi:heme O synthase, protoheme IX farnesyltransferase COX10-CtaB [Pseudoalteromonas sp. SW0106-04]|uniref:heme o synthase n=1 Tax=Pseudoalteromonas sp. SW0106-04 TaxID=1702169 RepID=UPI0006B64741|nr:heme o synthase [Pseudoalteromonas sp. SW0106-04]GAP73874.1 heme O synthase, protoheme IX farnesyltransferase COX10-CtaB [Pseudoalteromonas sp. SW0106-04]